MIQNFTPLFITTTGSPAQLSILHWLPLMSDQKINLKPDNIS